MGRPRKVTMKTQRLTPGQLDLLKALHDGEWHEQHPLTSDSIARLAAKRGLVDRDVARGKRYGITHPTRLRITPAGRASLRMYWP